MISGIGASVRHARRRLPWWPIIVLAITLLAWQPLGFMPAPGLDPSWGAGLELATYHGLAFGRDMVFTYGPLGFLSVQPSLWIASLAKLAFAYVFVVRLATAAALFLGARRAFGWPLALVLAVIVANVAGASEASVLFIVAMWALRQQLTDRRVLTLALVLGAASGIELLNKVSTGGTFALVTALTLLSLPGHRWKAAMAGAIGAVVAFLACWLAAGQPLDAVFAYIRGALQISSGYSAAMGTDVTPVNWIYAAALAILVGGAWAAWSSNLMTAGRQRWGAVLIWIVFWFSSFKAGLVREDGGHVGMFVQAMLIGWFAFYWRREHRGVALTGVVALTVLVLAVQGRSLGADLHLQTNLTGAYTDLRTIASPPRRTAVINAGRALIERTEPIDPVTLGLLHGRPVAVLPTEISLVWAYGLDWRPLPVMQAYSAYTPYLDGLDASFLSSSKAPQRILMTPASSIDGRVPGFDQPRAVRTLLCRYRALRATPTYAVLGGGPNRCSAPRLLGTQVAAWGRSVPVPAPPTADSLVSVRISGVAVSGLESIWSLLFKPAERFVILNGSSFRLVDATAGDGLPLRTSGALDYPDPFALVPQARTIGVSRMNQPQGGRPITFRFYWQSFAPR